MATARHIGFSFLPETTGEESSTVFVSFSAEYGFDRCRRERFKRELLQSGERDVEVGHQTGDWVRYNDGITT